MYEKINHTWSVWIWVQQQHRSRRLVQGCQQPFHTIHSSLQSCKWRNHTWNAYLVGWWFHPPFKSIFSQIGSWDPKVRGEDSKKYLSSHQLEKPHMEWLRYFHANLRGPHPTNAPPVSWALLRAGIGRVASYIYQWCWAALKFPYTGVILFPTNPNNALLQVKSLYHRFVL